MASQIKDLSTASNADAVSGTGPLRYLYALGDTQALTLTLTHKDASTSALTLAAATAYEFDSVDLDNVASFAITKASTTKLNCWYIEVQ